jgi:hypothetical protein
MEAQDPNVKVIEGLLNLGRPLSAFTQQFIHYAKDHYQKGKYDNWGDGKLGHNFYSDLFQIVAVISDSEPKAVTDITVDRLVIKALVETCEPNEIEAVLFKFLSASDPVAMIGIVIHQLALLQVANENGPIYNIGLPDPKILPLKL